MTPEQLEGPLVHPGDLPTSPDIRKGLLTTHGHLGGPSDHSRTFEIAFRPLPDIR